MPKNIAKKTEDPVAKTYLWAGKVTEGLELDGGGPANPPDELTTNHTSAMSSLLHMAGKIDGG